MFTETMEQTQMFFRDFFTEDYLSNLRSVLLAAGAAYVVYGFFSFFGWQRSCRELVSIVDGDIRVSRTVRKTLRQMSGLHDGDDKPAIFEILGNKEGGWQLYALAHAFLWPFLARGLATHIAAAYVIIMNEGDWVTRSAEPIVAEWEAAKNNGAPSSDGNPVDKIFFFGRISKSEYICGRLRRTSMTEAILEVARAKRELSERFPRLAINSAVYLAEDEARQGSASATWDLRLSNPAEEEVDE